MKSNRFMVAVLAAAMVIAVCPYAAADDSDAMNGKFIAAEKFSKSKPIRDMAPFVATYDREIKEPREVPNDPVAVQVPGMANRPEQGPSPALQRADGISQPVPGLSIEGYGSDDNIPIAGGRFAPPDTEGDVSPNYYFQWNNVGFLIFNKGDGSRVLPDPLPGNIFWTDFGGDCEFTNNGDPIVVYDQLADRWLVSQFTGNLGEQCVALSVDGDPLGAYFRWSFLVEPTGFNDYPKITVWPSMYGFSEHFFGGGFNKFGAFDRAAMLAGDPDPFFFTLDPADDSGDFYRGAIPFHLEGPNPPPSDTLPFVMAFDDEWWSGNPPVDGDVFKLWFLDVDWEGESFDLTGPIDIPGAEHDMGLCGGSRDCVPQPDTAQRLDALADFTMYRASYRNFDSHESVVVTNTTDNGSGVAGIHWAELRDSGSGWTVRQEGIFDGGGDGYWRFVPSVSMDASGSICATYTRSGAGDGEYPSVYYACHEEGVDPLGTLGNETVCVAGAGSQLAVNRWGDYSTTSIDPSDDCTFWGTNEYVAVTGTFFWHTRVCSWILPTCGATLATLNGTVTDAESGDPVEGALVTIGVVANAVTDENGEYEVFILGGTYDITVSKFGFGTAVVEDVVLTDGMTTTQDFALLQSEVVVVDGFVTDGSGAGFPVYSQVMIDWTGSQPTPMTTVFTDPATGYYQAEVYAGLEYEFTAVPQISGYLPTSLTTVAPGVDFVQNIEVGVDPLNCAPGYEAFSIEEAFEDGVPPAGWTVIDNELSGVIWSNIAGCGEAGNFTNGSGDAACASSDIAGIVEFDTELRTENFALDAIPEEATVIMGYSVNYQNLSGLDFLDTDVSFDGGESWINIISLNEDTGTFRGTPGVDFSFDVTELLAGEETAQFRFHYYDPNDGDWDWYAQVDDFFVVAGDCEYVGGSYIFGTVTDEVTGEAINGATVSTDLDQVAETVATPDDPNVGDGFYFLFIDAIGNGPSQREVTAEKEGYGSVSRTVTPTPNAWVEENFELPRGLLTVDTEEIVLWTPMGGTDSVDTDIDNIGTFPAGWMWEERNAPEMASMEGPQFQPDLPYRTGDDDKEAYAKSLATENPWDNNGPRPVPLRAAAPQLGEPITEFPTDVVYGWGIGNDQLSFDKFWLSDLGAAGGTDFNYEYATDFVSFFDLTGNAIDVAPLGAVFMADMAWNSATNTMWQVAVGGGDCIHEFDPMLGDFTGNTICPPFGTSMRGLAYDPVTDTYWAGTWNGNFIMHFDPEGNDLGQWAVGIGVSGLAYNPDTGHLFALESILPPSANAHVFDAFDPNLPLITSFDFGGGGANVSPAGLEMACDGTLWGVDQDRQVVMVVNSGETTSKCAAFDIPWLSEDPVSGTEFPDNGDVVDTTSTVTGDADGLTIGLHRALLLLTSDTPDDDIAIPVYFTNGFMDVPEENFAERFIHALAGAGITYGCDWGMYCPDELMTRRVMSAWILRSAFGADYNPPPATGIIFQDVAPDSLFSNYIEDFFNQGYTSGCSADPPLYCPDNPLTRAQMAVFILLGIEGPGYTPPACSGIFADVTCPSPFAPWVEELYNRGITSGCGTDPLRYCPNSETTRAQMAVFLVTGFGFPIAP